MWCCNTGGQTLVVTPGQRDGHVRPKRTLSRQKFERKPKFGAKSYRLTGKPGMLVQISENSATVTPYGSLGNVHQTVSSEGHGLRGTVRHRAGMRLMMRTLMVAMIGALIALVFACSAARADWASNTYNTADADETDLDALAISEQDDASLIVACVRNSKFLAIVFREPRANWQRGEALDALITSDAGDYRRLPLNGNVIERTVVAMRGKNAAVADADVMTTYADETAAIALIGRVQESFSISVGGYTRSFSASNFHDAVEPVLRQCGLAWFGNDVKEVTD